MAPRKPNLKEFTASLLAEHLFNQNPLLMEWECQYCFKHHRGNLMKKVVSIDSELPGDANISLRDAEGKEFAAIGISKNKNINQAQSDHYRGIGVIYIEIAAPHDSEKLLEALLKPRFVDSCLNPRCKDCGGYQIDKEMLILNSVCWKCNAPMKMAMIETPGHHIGPEDFTVKETELARSKGVILETRYSNVTNSSYLANICPQCNMFTGAFHLFDDHYIDAMYDDSKYERIPQGYFCENCYQNN